MTIKKQGYKRSTHMDEIKEQMKQPVDEKEALDEEAGKDSTTESTQEKSLPSTG